MAGAALIAQSGMAAEKEGGKKVLKVGLIGCGGRGKGALKDFIQAAKILGYEVEITAVGDAFLEVAKALGSANGVAVDRCYGGFDNYKKVIATDCEYVLNAVPPSFRPLHFAAAVEAGKHCFIEKPVAVDPPGARRVMEIGKVAQAKGLAVVAGTQRRHMAGYLRNKQLIEAGAIGQIKGGVVQWNGEVPWEKPRKGGEKGADYLARNWLNFTELSGDHIVEQHIHNLDIAVWYLGRLPVSALGYGGRARRKTGNQYDFFSVDYDFGKDVHIHSQCRQMKGTYQACGETFYGTEGVCYGGGKLNGKKVEIKAITVDSENGQVQEHVDMIRSVVAGTPINDAQRIAEVTMVAIMGRISAYTGALVKMDDLLKNKDSQYYNLTCRPQPEDFEKGEVEVPVEKPAVPGVES